MVACVIKVVTPPAEKRLLEIGTNSSDTDSH